MTSIPYINHNYFYEFYKTDICVCVLLYVIIWYWNSPKRSKKNKWDHPIRCVAPGGQIRPRVRPPSKDLGAKWWVKCWNHQLFWDFMKISWILIRNPYIFVHETSWNDPCLGCWADQSSNFHGKLRILRHSQSLRSKLSGVSEVGRILGRIAPGSGGVLSCCVASPGRDPWDMLGPLGSFSAKPRLEVRWLFGAFSRFPWTPKCQRCHIPHWAHGLCPNIGFESFGALDSMSVTILWPFYDAKTSSFLKDSQSQTDYPMVHRETTSSFSSRPAGSCVELRTLPREHSGCCGDCVYRKCSSTPSNKKANTDGNDDHKDEKEVPLTQWQFLHTGMTWHPAF